MRSISALKLGIISSVRVTEVLSRSDTVTNSLLQLLRFWKPPLHVSGEHHLSIEDDREHATRSGVQSNLTDRVLKCDQELLCHPCGTRQEPAPSAVTDLNAGSPLAVIRAFILVAQSAPPASRIGQLTFSRSWFMPLVSMRWFCPTVPPPRAPARSPWSRRRRSRCRSRPSRSESPH